MNDLFPEELETERLRIERFCRENVDLTEAYRHFGDRETIEEEIEYLTWNRHETVKETYDLLVETEEQWAEGAKAMYVLRPKTPEEDAGTFAGITGLEFDWDRRTAISGIWLRKPFWGRGYTLEHGRPLFELAFDRLDLELVTSGTIDGNEKARRAIEKRMEKYGGQYDGILRNWIPTDDGVKDLHRYTITKEQFEANR